MKVKINLNDLLDRALGIIGKSKSKVAREDGWAISVGLDIFTAYLKDICNRAIEIEDPIILECLINCGIVTADKEEEQQIIEKAKILRNKENDNDRARSDK